MSETRFEPKDETISTELAAVIAGTSGKVRHMVGYTSDDAAEELAKFCREKDLPLEIAIKAGQAQGEYISEAF